MEFNEYNKKINRNNSVSKAYKEVKTNYKSDALASKNKGLVNNMNNKKIHILLFYKFQKIKNPEHMRRKFKIIFNNLLILGKILIAKEGINGSISGAKKQVEKFKEFLWSLPEFSDIKFKEEISFKHPFSKRIIRVRDEIVSLHKNVDINKTGKHLSPREFLNLYEKKYEGIILDARNYYEYELGRFKNAIHGNIKTFREFPKFVEKFKKKFSKKEKGNKKIIMYCTGGIRCEKASAYMKNQGFKNVYQLEGGIINFCQQFPDTIWEGKCFVFDKRLMTDLNQNNKPITKCINCYELCDLYRNCKNVECDKLVIMCFKCQEKLQGCCSINCLTIFQRYARKRAELKKIGRWEAKEILQSYVK